jgi:hypothetical protein
MPHSVGDSTYEGRSCKGTGTEPGVCRMRRKAMPLCSLRTQAYTTQTRTQAPSRLPRIDHVPPTQFFTPPEDSAPQPPPTHHTPPRAPLPTPPLYASRIAANEFCPPQAISPLCLPSERLYGPLCVKEAACPPGWVREPLRVAWSGAFNARPAPHSENAQHLCGGF